MFTTLLHVLGLTLKKRIGHGTIIFQRCSATSAIDN